MKVKLAIGAALVVLGDLLALFIVTQPKRKAYSPEELGFWVNVQETVQVRKPNTDEFILAKIDDSILTTETAKTAADARATVQIDCHGVIVVRVVDGIESGSPVNPVGALATAEQLVARSAQQFVVALPAADRAGLDAFPSVEEIVSASQIDIAGDQAGVADDLPSPVRGDTASHLARVQDDVGEIIRV